jgi:putative (di)nucleoside polyphosphate hydrolase
VAEPEFCEWRWLRPAELMRLIVPFKRSIYEDVFAEFGRFLA